MTRKRAAQLDLLGVPARGASAAIARTFTRAGRGRAVPAPKPWQCVVLAVDTARRSGWAVYCVGKLHSFGEVDTLDEAHVGDVVYCAIDAAAHADAPLPCVLVLEAPWGGSVDVVAALGAARERWLRAWRAHKQSPARVVRVKPSTWRSAVLGGRWVGKPREEVRAHELFTARLIVNTVDGLGADEAAAILIGRWAAQARAVGRVIGKRATRASLAAWGFR